jgi:hypothetical protein
VAIAEALSVFYQNVCFDSAFSNWRRHFYWVSEKRKGILLYRNWYKFEIDSAGWEYEIRVDYFGGRIDYAHMNIILIVVPKMSIRLHVSHKFDVDQDNNKRICFQYAVVN